MELKQQLNAITQQRFSLAPESCTDEQLYHALLELTQQQAMALPAPAGDRKLYYFSAEFLMGKLLSNKDRKSTRLNSSHGAKSRMPSSA